MPPANSKSEMDIIPPRLCDVISCGSNDVMGSTCLSYVHYTIGTNNSVNGM